MHFSLGLGLSLICETGSEFIDIELMFNVIFSSLHLLYNMLLIWSVFTLVNKYIDLYE